MLAISLVICVLAQLATGMEFDPIVTLAALIPIAAEHGLGSLVEMARLIVMVGEASIAGGFLVYMQFKVDEARRGAGHAAHHHHHHHPYRRHAPWLASRRGWPGRLPSCPGCPIVSPSWMPYRGEGWLRVSAEEVRSGGSVYMAVVLRRSEEAKKVKCKPHASATKITTRKVLLFGRVSYFYKDTGPYTD